MASGIRFTPEHDPIILATEMYVDYVAGCAKAGIEPRDQDAVVRRRYKLKRDAGQMPQRGGNKSLPSFWSDKKIGTFNWRQAAEYVSGLQQIRHEASWSQDEATIHIDSDHPICVVTLSDTHLGAWSADHELFVRITDEILNTPNLYVILLGDLLNMSIKLRGVGESQDDLLPAELQHLFLEQWLEEIAHRVLVSTWDNHAIEREETQSGASVTARILSRRCIYHSGIGHADILVGKEVYRLAVSHHFQGRSIYNPVHGAQRYLVMQGHEREIAACGDSHVPGLMQFVHGGQTKLAINSGSTQVNSRYAKRYFSLTTAHIFPCFVLDPHAHRFTPYWSVADWVANTASASAPR